MEPNLSKKRKLELSSDSNICSNIELSKKAWNNLSGKKE